MVTTTQDFGVRLAANPKSPVFVRLADDALRQGDPRRGAEICLEGLRHHPAYGTAHLVLARCYEALGRDVQALLEYRRALRSIPDNPSLLAAVDRLERRRTNTAPPPEQLLPVVSAPAQEQAAVPAPAVRMPESAAPVDTPAPSGATRIVTATLAEIYASQGEYSEAIAAYQRLLVLRPSDSARYRRRLEELEELLRVHREFNG